MNLHLPFVEDNFDPLTFGLFFGSLALLGLLEIALARKPETTARRTRWPANIALTALNLAILSILPVSGVAVAYMAQSAGWGLFNAVALGPVALIVAGFLARSLISYLIHVLMHKVPAFWRLHMIHHSDTALDVSTTVRFHPLEFVISLPLVLATISLLGIPPTVVMLYELFDAVLATLSHANLRLPERLERALQWVIVTPAMHRIHHSSHQPETDSNYGATLSLWDRMFGTYRRKSSDELDAMELGLSEYRDRRPSSVYWLLTAPLRRQDANPTERREVQTEKPMV